jgi:hypothetical protein
MGGFLRGRNGPRASNLTNTFLSLPTEFCENLSADCRENVIMTQILPCIKVIEYLVVGFGFRYNQIQGLLRYCNCLTVMD